MLTIDLNTHNASKIAGVLFLFFIAISMLHYTVIEINLISAPAEKIEEYVKSNELLFRAGIVTDLILFMTGLTLAAILYTILQPVHRTLALLSLLWILVETVMSVIIELSSFASLLLINESTSMQFGAVRAHALLKMILDLRILGYGVVMLFFSLGYACFFYLFMRSSYIPAILSVSGLLLSLLLLLAVLVQMILPVTIIEMMVQISSGLVMLHQIALGLWLLIKGINVQN